MKQYEIKEMIIDEEFHGEEYVTTTFTQNNKDYRVTFQKGDLELMNAWIFENGTSLPANLSEDLIDSLREDVKKKI